MIINGYELQESWQGANMSETAKAIKGSKTYILKKYTEVKAPVMDESMTDSLFEKLMAKFNRFVEYRKRINQALSSVAVSGGNIVPPCDSFIYENTFVEATEFIPGLMPEDAAYSFTTDELVMVMKTVVAALISVHSQKIVHSDLKEGNLAVTQNSAGVKVGKLIDFDRAYFEDDIITEYVGGTQNFMAPELVYLYINEMAPEAAEYLSCKADVFSLGILFHKYLTGGQYPEISDIPEGPLQKRIERGEVIYCGEASLMEAKLHVSEKIKEKYLSHIIANMIIQDPEQRISLTEVLDALKNKTVLPFTACESVVIDGEDVGFADPWPEHNIELDLATLESRDYISLERILHNGDQCYRLYKRSGTKRILTLQNMLILDLAKKKGGEETPRYSVRPVNIELGEASVWEEHADYDFDYEAISAVGYIEARKAVKSSIRGYALIRSNGTPKFFVFENMKVLGYLKLK